MANTLMTADEAARSFKETIDECLTGLSEDEKREAMRELANWLAGMRMAERTD
jgi:hypothetical protein